MKKPLLVGLIGLLIAISTGIWAVKISRRSPSPSASPYLETEIPVNTISIEERPFVTLTPDASGRNLTLTVSGAPTEGELEYELIYQAMDKQEGVFGRLDLSSEPQPIAKKLLLGSKSAGGKVTYHEGVTGGTLTLAYQGVKLKESFNFLRFDPADPAVTSVDGRFGLEFAKDAFAKDTVIIVMKSFGLPAALPVKTAIKAGPYAYLVGTPPKGEITVSLRLPAGEHADPTLYGYNSAFADLDAKLSTDTLSTLAVDNLIFVATAH